jgi:hypothetical protein
LQAPHPTCDCPSAGLHGCTIPSQPPVQPPVMLCISPSEEGGACGFIYLSSREISDQAAIIAYFNNAGRDVSVLPCQGFNEFLASNHLRVPQVSFVTDLPNYIIPMGRPVIEENYPSKEVAPNLSWLPSSPSISSRSGNSRPTVRAGFSSPAFSSSTFLHGAGSNLNGYTASEWEASSADVTSSGSTNSSQQFFSHSIPPVRTGSGPTTSAMTTRGPHADTVKTPHRPDPNGIVVPNTPLFFSMGVPASIGNFSPPTTSNGSSLQGGSLHRSYILTPVAPHPSSGASVMTSAAGSMLSPPSDSSDSATQAAPPRPPSTICLHFFHQQISLHRPPSPHHLLPPLLLKTNHLMWGSNQSQTKKAGQKQRRSSMLDCDTHHIGQENPKN